MQYYYMCSLCVKPFLQTLRPWKIRLGNPQEVVTSVTDFIVRAGLG
jgi:hypothetical protein